MTEPHSSSMRERSRVDYPSLAWICARPGRFLAFGLGSGLIRPASGTWGTLAAWVIWLLLPPIPNLAMGILLALAFAYGCWACGYAGKELRVHDHVGMVWDEMVAFWLVLWLVPGGWMAQLLAFVLFRFFDIVKPPPIKTFDARLSGGFGVMWDDILAAVYALLVMAFVVRLGVLA
ncbi:phosphatidylglycerophosphatase A [Bordetella holmesii CDC-H635-BH]|uniref:Phosphatidylglycerophosphatase A n=2 Tax=Bordetella holmesii TaxID=35814 RepID=A0A158M125_9BORD|nr:phosphatidylglycerophosphatase A [Bordetella holmesii CDC-H572-BH]KAK82131.1 phosphatidylglycerophosphatase A [Bordetella holmesii H620]KAK88284.1 phosphatidylglycerophosphatase A [Bordetella holmesii CDC-H585-BH]KAK89582.1 phosphatidylglycerophosphatase A [Bordetella holmesii CDC-H635-BH]KCV02832.1 phosphatidylglycerophosphatase A [Bordetella holmesii CDC-H629-BH]KCV03798.1 phosphatidylglycerophosphatase A [Bordetella holmesii CDC-H719-BH]KCV09123.1 phosphatidylglycerophosphatase A [Borde